MTMYKHFMQSYDLFKEGGTADPLFETLRLFDLLSAGKVSEALSGCGNDSQDVAGIACERNKGVPMEYILGTATFNGRSFFCTKDTLIPTEETILLVLTAHDFIKKRLLDGLGPQTVIEIGTGCGNIALTLAGLCNDDVNILASDVSAPAVEIAKKNADRFDADKKVSLFCGDLFEPFTEYNGKTDMVICNPPYIPSTSLKKLASEIIDHEPIVALDGGPYGINFFRRLISEALNMLKPHGILIFEIGQGQEKLIRMLFDKNGAYEDIRFFKHGEHVRVISAVRR
jgi:release factor glutamine methyltransferase